MPQFDEADLKRRFTFHPADGKTGAVHDSVRESVHGCAQDLCELVPPGRELSCVLTALEEAMMWGNAGVARAAADERAIGEGDEHDAGETSVASGDEDQASTASADPVGGASSQQDEPAEEKF